MNEPVSEADPQIKDRLLNDLSSSLDSRRDEPLVQPPALPPSVPDHKLLRRIGKGSYGEVWLARNVMGTFRAVKVVYRRAFDNDRPYEREFAGIRRFEPVSRTHPSQLNVLHVGRDDRAGYFYYVMELADDLNPELGTQNAESTSNLYAPRTLRSDLQQRGALPFEECLKIGIALATALDHLHRHGLVHRDIKPSNIVFVNGIPKLADIGLVAQAEATMSFVGTEGFVPPEGPGTPQADIYSLGKVLYEMSTGRDRHEFPELPTNLIERDAYERAGLEELNEVILRACHVDPKQRYATAGEMHADLALLDSGRSVVRLRGIERRLRLVRRAGTLVTVLAFFIAVGWWWQVRQTQEVRDLATQKSQLADEKAKLVELARQRILHLDIANGVRFMDDGDPAGALLWFADALPLLTNNPAEESIHRIRLQQTLEHSPRLLNVFPHAASVQCAIFSPDERQIATACEDGFVRLWDPARNDKPLRDFRQPTTPRFLRYTRDGRRLLVITAPDLLRYNPPLCLNAIDPTSGAQVFTLTNFIVWAASPNDHWFAVGGTDNAIHIHELSTGGLLGTALGHRDLVTDLHFTSDSAQIISAGNDGTVRRWEAPSGSPVGPTLQFEGSVVRAVLSPDQQRLATVTVPNQGAERLEFQIGEALSGTPLSKPTETDRDVLVMTFDRTGRYLLVGNQQPVLCRQDASSGVLLPALNLPSYACSVDTSPTEDLIALGADNGSVSIWNVFNGSSVRPSPFHAARVESVHFDSSGQRLLTASGDGTVKLWHVATPQPAAALRLPGQWPKVGPEAIRPSFVREAGPIQIPLLDGTVRLIDPDSLREMHCLIPSSTNLGPYNCEASPNGRHWQVSGGGVMDLFSEMADGTIRRVALQPSGEAFGGVFSPDSCHLVTFGGDRQIRVWSTGEGHLELSVPIPEPFTEAVHCLADVRRVLLAQDNGVHQWFDLPSRALVGSAFRMPATWATRLDPTGRRLGLMGRDQTLRIWDIDMGEPARLAFKHAGTAIHLDWNPDGRRLLTAGLSPDARIWDVLTGEQLLSPLALGSEPMRVARWSSDGRFVVARNDAQLVRVWDAATAEPVTPKLRQENYVRYAALHGNHRLIVLTDPNLVQSWELAETKLPADVIADYARFVSGRRLNTAGVTVPMSASELATLNQSLRTRVPELFQ